MLQAVFLITLNKPKIKPIIHAKNNPHNANNNVLPMAVNNIEPYTVIILSILPTFLNQIVNTYLL